MSNDPNTKKFKQWLDVLQQESWQLELIISGFAIYGLFAMKESLDIGNIVAQNNDNMYRVFLMQGLLTFWHILTLNLLIHVVLRGLWIGAIGLRYVSGDIDYEELNYSPKFNRHLQKRVGSFDRYVASLERYCSVIFAVTFLLLFYILGLLALATIFTLLGLSLDRASTPDIVRYWVIIPLIVFLAIGTVITFIDFVTQGWLKRKKWTTWFYYSIYWIFKYLTLSFLYRPMVYNFIDTKFGRRLSIFLVPLYLFIAFISQTGFSTSNYLEEDLNSNTFIANVENYDDEIAGDKLKYVNLASIPSKVIKNSFLKVFIEYGANIEDDVFYFNPDLKPEKDKRGIYSAVQSGTSGYRDRYKNLKAYLATLEDMYTLRVDSTAFAIDFVFTQNSKGQQGFETVLDLKDFKREKHMLEISRKDVRRIDSVYVRKIITIPFWLYPE